MGSVCLDGVCLSGIFIFRRICNMQEKLFIHSFFFFFQSKIATSFYPKKMSAVGLGQQRSEAVGLGSNLCRVRYFYDFTDICRNLQLFPWHSG